MGRWLVTSNARTAWRLGQLLTVAALAYGCWRLFPHAGYRIDVDVYRMGGQAWLQGRPLYADGAMFATQAGLDLPFTYPPLAAVVFSPLALMPLPAAGAVITVITLVLLVASLWIVLTRLSVAQTASALPGPPWARRAWIAVAIVAASVTTLEPIQANFSFGQINVVLMTLVIADCLPRRTLWPRGLLLGLAIAVKLTPAVFLLYFFLRRDVRAVLWSLGSFAAATAVGFMLAGRDSVEYWTHTVRDTDRIGSATWNTNQNAAGALARLDLGAGVQFALWTTACLLVLALTVWSVRRLLAAGEPAAGLICVALFGLVVSPVSWSHHWVWALPTVTVLTELAYRRRSAATALLAAAGVALMVWPTITLLPDHQEAGAAWWRQLFGVSYVWWALAVIGVTALTVPAPGSANRPRSPESSPAANLLRPV